MSTQPNAPTKEPMSAREAKAELKRLFPNAYPAVSEYIGGEEGSEYATRTLTIFENSPNEGPMHQAQGATWEEAFVKMAELLDPRTAGEAV